VTRRVDVAVLGGGAAGGSVAIALARGGARVAVLHDERRRGRGVGEALPPVARPLLDELGLRRSFLADGHLPCHGNRSLWGGVEPETYEFIRDPYGVGWHLDRARFDAGLADAARAAGASWHAGVRAAAWRRIGSGWSLETAGRGRAGRLRADVVVDATGRGCTFARRQGVERVGDDCLVAVVTWLSATGTQVDTSSLNLVESVRDGWWYAALHPSGQLVTALMSDGDIVAGGRLHETDRWRAAVAGTRLVSGRLQRHGYRVTQGPRALVAGSSRLTAASGDGWLAVGDAAAAYDPLSSQGITCALATGLWAARSIAEGTEAALRRYADRVAHLYARYRAELAACYGLERRWAGSAFWQRRHARVLGR
jgi:flavin-dependent dehydrogenase